MQPIRLAPVLAVALIAWPIAEIAAFVWVGGRIGLVNTLALVLLAGFAGVLLLRAEGLALARRLQAELAAGRMPAGELLEAACVLIAAVLLLLPGFLSDVFAFLLLFAPVRRLILRQFAKVVTVRTVRGGERGRRGDGVVDLDAEDYRRHDAAGGATPWSDGPGILLPGGRRDDPDRP